MANIDFYNVNLKMYTEFLKRYTPDDLENDENDDYTYTLTLMKTYRDDPSSYSELQQFQDIFMVRTTLLKMKLLLCSQIITTNDIMVGFVEKEIMQVNEYKKHSIENFVGEKQQNIIQEVENIKNQIYELVCEYEVKLPFELACEICRTERIYRILIAEEMIGDNFGPSVGKVLQNKDLNRYLLEFI